MSTNETTVDADADQLPERLELRSETVTAEHRDELLRLFPEVATEGGKIDFDQLKRALGEHVDVGKERYGIAWPGKSDCFKVIQTPSTGTLLPSRAESVNFDATENVIIESDSLEALKLLQKSYLGKVKTVYIDPPYNTGSDFIYPDDYTESLQTYMEYTGQVDSEGKRFSTNTDTDGRFHSKWLNMMYPRLYLARNLLREDGSIWISIDDGEASNLRLLCNSVFGEENFVATFIWEKRTTRENRRVFSFNHDYILCFARDKLSFQAARGMLPLSETVLKRYTNPDNDLRGPWQSVSLNVQAGHATDAQFYTITTPGGRSVDPPPGRAWSVTRPVYELLVTDERVWFGADGTNVPREKIFLSEAKDGLTPHTLWTAAEAGTNDQAKKALLELFDGTAVYETPKPVALLTRILNIATSATGGDIVLDFFAGSGTTAEAVEETNRQDGGNRRYILVQLPEPTGRDDYPTISDITKERVRRVLRKLNVEDKGRLDLHENRDVNLGFRVFKLSESNFTAWDAQGPEDAAGLEAQLELHVNHVRDGRSDEDLLHEILLKSGFPLTTMVETVELAGKNVFSVADGALLLCLDRDVTLDLVREMAERAPARMVCLDEGFAGNDQLKVNAVQAFKTKGITSFKTV